MPERVASKSGSQSRRGRFGFQVEATGGGNTIPALTQSVLMPRQRNGDMPMIQVRCPFSLLVEQQFL